MNKVFQCGTESILNSTKGLQAYRHKSQKFHVVTFLKNYNISHELNTEVLINWVCLRLYKLSPIKDFILSRTYRNIPCLMRLIVRTPFKQSLCNVIWPLWH